MVVSSRNFQPFSETVIATEAILIRSTRLTETSLIVHWFTESEGLVKSVVKGALRPRSAFAGKLDLFFSADVVLAKGRQGEWYTLREVSVLQWREGLRRSYLSTLMAGYFCQLVEGAVEPGHADPPLHDLLRRGLDYLDGQDASLRAMRHFENQMAEILGVYGGAGGSAQGLSGHMGRLPPVRAEILERLGMKD